MNKEHFIKRGRSRSTHDRLRMSNVYQIGLEKENTKKMVGETRFKDTIAEHLEMQSQ